jgi:hypothetical protein
MSMSTDPLLPHEYEYWGGSQSRVLMKREYCPSLLHLGSVKDTGEKVTFNPGSRV